MLVTMLVAMATVGVSAQDSYREAVKNTCRQQMQ